MAALAFLAATATAPRAAMAADLPLAAGSPLAGFAFDDRPLLLPPQRNFQMAMLTASSELGRSCGKMESYGWRMSQNEQQRVNLIFNNTVDRLRGLGYAVEMQSPSSVSRDVTIFTADKSSRHLVFMWSAGEIGLVMVLCESSTPAAFGKLTPPPAASAQNFPQDVLQSKLDAPAPAPRRGGTTAPFSPTGDWVGAYTCHQGTTGATLSIARVKRGSFDGVFHFYPTARDPYVPEGRYTVYGQYDDASRRILINPGKWLQRPKDFYNTIMIGSFDPITRTFSGYFQGITGCTSFEARQESGGAKVSRHAKTPKAKAVKTKAQKKHTQTKNSKRGATEAKSQKATAPKISGADAKAPSSGTTETVAPADASIPSITLPATTNAAAPAPAPAQSEPPAPAAPAAANNPSPAAPSSPANSAPDPTKPVENKAGGKSGAATPSGHTAPIRVAGISGGRAPDPVMVQDPVITMSPHAPPAAAPLEATPLVPQNRVAPAAPEPIPAQPPVYTPATSPEPLPALQAPQPVISDRKADDAPSPVILSPRAPDAPLPEPVPYPTPDP